MSYIKALICRPTIPFYRFGVVLCYPLAILITPPKSALRYCATLLCRFAIPLNRLYRILRYALAVL